ncbi:AAA family ATPase [Streptomyces sp. NPDC008313]|uniref:helix-turn-helix transcriptional regulator n=1 Tax=Streptomyces sp. NPDC008313 TaxID=3364826 RepID=UPI0036E226F3
MTGQKIPPRPLRPPRLHGRSVELETVDTLLARLRSGRGGALLLTGAPGLGRTALLTEVRHAYDQGAVWHTRATRAESRIPYGGLHALLSAGGVPEAERARPGRAPRPLGILRARLEPAALLELLGERVAAEPLLVCVDDVHLWDGPSRAALGFVARRLDTPRPVGLLLSAAGRGRADGDLAGLPLVRLGPLDRAAAGALLDDRAPCPLDPAVRAELVRETAGNPRLLSDLLAALSPRQLQGEAPLPRPLVGPDALLRVRGAGPGDLPSGARLILLLAAAAHEQDPEGHGADLTLVLRAAGTAGAGRAELSEAEDAGLLRVAGERLVFDDEPLRRALYAGAPQARRRRAHALLALAHAGERQRLPRLLHRALAVTGPDPRLAADLVSTAEDDPRWTHAERSVALERAAGLTEHDGARVARLAAAAEHARLAGRPERARALLAEARPLPAHDAVRGRAELVRGLLGLQDGPVADAYEVLRLAAELMGPYDPRRTGTARLAAMEAAWQAGDALACLHATTAPASPARPGQAPGRSRTEPERAFADEYREGTADLLSGRTERGRTVLRGLVARGEHAGDPRRLVCAGAAALLVGDLAAACRVHARALAVARSRGLATLVPLTLERLAYAELRAGRHLRARVHAEEGLRAALRTGQRNLAAHQHAVLALVASVEGDARAVGEHAAACCAVAEPHGLVQAATLAQWALARTDLSRGRAPEAAARLGPLVRPGPRGGHFAVRMLAVPCYVEAAVLAGEPDGAPAAVDEFAVWTGMGVDPGAPALLARCRALLETVESGNDPGADGTRTGVHPAEARYAEALARHDLAGGDFERARTQLLFGQWLRRRRRPGEARGRLRDALVAFERCGARAWAQHTRAELRATGDAPAHPPPGALTRLTPQQLRIARFVAEGATNREVAMRLSVSPRTVDHHLRNAFALLGVRSRVELARIVDRDDGPAPER